MDRKALQKELVMKTVFQAIKKDDTIRPLQIIRQDKHNFYIQDGAVVKKLSKLNEPVLFDDEAEAIQYMIEYHEDRIRKGQAMIAFLSQDISDAIDGGSFWKERLRSVQLSLKEMFEGLRKEMG